MSLSFNRQISPLKCSISLNDDLWGNDEKWIVWWYGGLFKNERPGAQPYADVFFRKVVAPGQLSDGVIHRRVLSEYLGKLVVGTIWENKICREIALYDVERFEVNFSANEWSLTSFNTDGEYGVAPPFPQNLYPLHQAYDMSWLISLKLASGGNLLVPCLEFFSRCYGHSPELRRVLLTYLWDGTSDSVVQRLFAPLNEPEESNRWKVKSGLGLAKRDVPFLAHVKYDDLAKKAAKMVNSQLQVDFNKRFSERPIFLKAGPWFTGPAKLKVAGLWFDNRRSFLALQVLGCTDPEGLTINRIVDYPRKDLGGKTEEGGESTGHPKRYIKQRPEIIDLTSQYAPDHNAGVIELLDREYEVLGKQRQITTKVRHTTDSGGTRLFQEHNADKFSTGDSFGGDKGVGRLKLNPSILLESEGTLRDMWNVALHFAQTRPDRICSVEWFTFEKGFQEELEPNLICFEPFSEDEEYLGSLTQDNFERLWPYLNTSTLEPRGVLLMRIRSKLEYVHIIEIQRRITMKKDKNGKTNRTEENFSGLVFRLDDDDDEKFRAWLTTTLKELRFAKGVLGKFTGSCPGSACTFHHRPTKRNQLPSEAAFRHALKKINFWVY